MTTTITIILWENQQNSLIVASISTSGNLQNAYKNAELSNELKQQWQAGSMYMLPVIISATGVIPHTLHDVLKMYWICYIWPYDL
jgi:hypothetical protein